MEVVIQPNAEAATEFVARIMAHELQTNPKAVLGLATGSTMESVYARLVKMHRDEGLSFSGCRTFNLDEYIGLLSSDRQSYRHYMNRHLFKKVDIHLRNTHLPNGAAADPNMECDHYERLISGAGGIDLMLLGIGRSGHVGFNEPPSDVRSRTRVERLSPTTIEQNGRHFGGADKMPRYAITMGVGTILECRRCVLLATGADKAAILAEAVEGPVTNMISASAMQLHSNCTVVVDEAAGSQLKKSAEYRRIYDSDSKWNWFRNAPSTRSQDERQIEPSLGKSRLESAA